MPPEAMMDTPDDLPRSFVLSLDLDSYFPQYRTLERLHTKLFTQKVYTGIGPGSVLEELLNWVVKSMQYQDETVYENKLPEDKRKNKDLRTYERLFFDYAITLWKKMPCTLQKAILLHSKHGAAVFLIAQTDSRWNPHELASRVRPEAFYRFNHPKQEVGV